MIDYRMARKRASRACRRARLEGRDPFVTVLDNNVEKNELYGREYLGTMEIPIHMIEGTKTEDRKNAFSYNFLPLLEPGSEFATKWENLLLLQMDNGFTDPIKVYEFMNRFYVEEGNKRVSIMKYLNGDSIMADVTRIIPPDSEDMNSMIYKEFMDFYNVTSYYGIVFNRRGSYRKLAECFGQDLISEWPRDIIEKMKTAYVFFGVILADTANDDIVKRAGDVFLEYLHSHSPEELIQTAPKALKADIEELLKAEKEETDEDISDSRPKRKLSLARFRKHKKRTN